MVSQLLGVLQQSAGTGWPNAVVVCQRKRPNVDVVQLPYVNLANCVPAKKFRVAQQLSQASEVQASRATLV